jgi:hypothetical protein
MYVPDPVAGVHLGRNIYMVQQTTGQGMMHIAGLPSRRSKKALG